MITTMTKTKDPDTILTAMKIARTEASHLIENTRTKELARLDAIMNAMEEHMTQHATAHKKALNRISNAQGWDEKTPTNTTAEERGRQTRRPSLKTRTKGERSKSCDPQTQDEWG